MVDNKIIISFVLLFTVVNARSINQHKVSIKSLSMDQYNTEVKRSSNVWMIQLIADPSDAFKDAAFVLRGVVMAGIIEDCNQNDICTNNTDEYKGHGRIVFKNSKDVNRDFTHHQDCERIVEKAKDSIEEQVKHQKDNIQDFKVQFVKFSIDKHLNI